ncbi:fimbrial protein [Burkholderia ubonensis]|uniref:fimbrial protein n=1 Tax=Burkholderia ubonensis TaxID=101571 RepID=UPI000B2483A7|nr:fimbrial protein [Burkholderia ubonensis]
MNKLILIAIPSILTALSGIVQAQSNTVTFNGEVVATTCNPAVANGNYTVTLDQVAQSTLTSNGVGRYSALSVPFSIQVLNCPAGVNSVGVVLDSDVHDAATGNLSDMTIYGSNAVQIRIMDGTTAAQQIVVGATDPVTYVAVSNGAATVPMAVYYYVKDATNVKVGKIRAVASYTLRIQ